MNTTDFLSIATAICPDRDVIVFEGKRWTYAHTTERINRLAHALTTLGVKEGDRIGMLEVNCNHYLEGYFAAAKLGAYTAVKPIRWPGAWCRKDISDKALA